ncbi:MAG: aminoacetone oxidase family FAD-binding enzyme, partial [Desulfonatronovibrionaceae bacterium]
MSQPKNLSADILVIGGGPAGLMAAIAASSMGQKVIVLEKMPRPARKLGITGKGRCNLTNSADMKIFLKSFASGEKFIRFALEKFSNQDLLDFLARHNVETVEERGGRIFPATQKAETVVRCLLNAAAKNKVLIRTCCRVKDLVIEDRVVQGVRVQEAPAGGPGPAGQKFYACGKIIVATGGASYPATGSTGDGYKLAQSAGHSLTPILPGLVPLESEDSRAKLMQGLTLRNVQAAVHVQGRKQDEQFGEMIFTHFGVSGPIILTMSKAAVKALNANQQVELIIDLKPAVSHNLLKNRIAREMHSQGRKKIANILKNFLPLKMIPVFLEYSRIAPDTRGCEITKAQQKALRLWCKELKMTISG